MPAMPTPAGTCKSPLASGDDKLSMSIDVSDHGYGKSLTHTRLSRRKSYQQTTLIYKASNSCQSFINTSLNVFLAQQSLQEAAIYLSPPVSQFLHFSALHADGYTLFHLFPYPRGLASSTVLGRGWSYRTGVNAAQPEWAACSGTSILFQTAHHLLMGLKTVAASLTGA